MFALLLSSKKGKVEKFNKSSCSIYLSACSKVQKFGGASP
jgi:hypothetical protein